MKFTITDEGKALEYYLEDGQDYTLGRESSCDIVLTTKGISRKHLSIKRQGDSCTLTDLGSKNGFLHNGKKATQAQLCAEDTFSFGANATLVVLSPTPKPAEEDAITPDDDWGAPSAEASAPAVPETHTALDIPNTPQNTKKPSKQRKVFLAKVLSGFAVFMILSLLLKLNMDGDTSEKVVPRQHYFELIDKGVSHLQGRRYDMARTPIQQANAMGTRFDLASILLDYIKVFDDAGPRLENMDWDKARSLCDEMQEIHPTTDRVQAFSTAEKSWLRKEGSHRATVLKIKRLYRQGDLQASYNLIQKVPASSYLYSVWDDFFKKVHKDYRNKVRIAAQQAFDKGEWETAKKLFEELKPLVLHSQEKNIQRTIAEATLLHSQERALAMAKGALKTGNTTRVKQYLSLIPSGSPFSREATLIFEQIKGSEGFVAALTAYTSGDVVTARHHLKVLNSPKARELETRMTFVLTAIHAAERSLQERKVDSAIKQWETIIRVEKNTENRYYKRAERNKQLWTKAHKAQIYYEWALDDYRADKIQLSRMWFNKATANDPEHHLGLKEVKKMRSDGEMDYNRGLNLQSHNPTEAKKYFKRAQQLLPSNHKLLQEIERYLP